MLCCVVLLYFLFVASPIDCPNTIFVCAQGFLGASAFLEKDGKLKPAAKKRVGIAGMKAPARGHTEIFTADGANKIGEITSGGFGPSFQKPMAMG